LGNAYHPTKEDCGLKTVCFHTTPAPMCGALQIFQLTEALLSNYISLGYQLSFTV